MLNDSEIEILRDKFIEIAYQEIETEKQRQTLAILEEFEPYATFLRLDRSNNGFLTANEIHSFLKENWMTKHSFEDCAYLVKFFDSDEDGVLDYTEYMKCVLTREDPYLRSVVAQRDPYRVGTDEYLSPILERELAILFQKELAYHHEINKFPDIPYFDAFREIDDEHLSFIDKQSIENFLIRCGITPTEEEMTAIFRRIDLSGDELISFVEFEETMRSVKLSRSSFEFETKVNDIQIDECFSGENRTISEFFTKCLNPIKTK